MLCASCAGLLDVQVVIDGCDDVGTLTSSGALALALSAGQGHVIVTTRVQSPTPDPLDHPMAAILKRQCYVLDVGAMPWKDAVSLLCSVRWGEQLSGECIHGLPSRLNPLQSTVRGL